MRVDSITDWETLIAHDYMVVELSTTTDMRAARAWCKENCKDRFAIGLDTLGTFTKSAWFVDAKDLEFFVLRWS